MTDTIWDSGHLGTGLTLVGGMRVATGISSYSKTGAVGTYGGATASSLLSDTYTPGDNGTIAGVQFNAGVDAGVVELVFSGAADFMGFLLDLDNGGSGFGNYHFTVSPYNGAYAVADTETVWAINQRHAKVFAAGGVASCTKLKVIITAGDPAPGTCEQAKVGGFAPLVAYGASRAVVFPHVGSGTHRAALASVGKNSGKRYFEVHLPFANGISVGPNVGLATSAVGLNVALGSTSIGWAIDPTGHAYTNNVQTTALTSYTATKVIGIYADLDAGTFGYTIDGATVGTVFSGLSAGTYYPAASVTNGDALNTLDVYLNGRFNAADLLYTPPLGYAAWSAEIVPVANFTRTPTSGAIPLSVAFTDTSTNTPTSWLWDFGDGSTSTSQNPTHIYTQSGEYTVRLTATNGGGSHTKTLVSAVSVGVRQVATRGDFSLGASAILRLGLNHHVIVSPDLRRLITTTISTTVAATESAAMDSEPWAIVSLSSKLWTVTSDGYLRRFTIADPPVAVDSLNIDAATNRWLTTAGSFVIAPGRSGIVSVNTSLVQVDEVDGLSGITLAIGTSGYVYCFDGHGLGHVVLVSAAGRLSYAGAFQAADCQGLLNGYLSGSNLVLGVVARNAVVVFDLTDPTAPVRSSRSIGTDTTRWVLDDNSHTALTDSPPSAYDLPTWRVPSVGTAAGNVTAIAFGKTARLSFSALAIPEV